MTMLPSWSCRARSAVTQVSKAAVRCSSGLAGQTNPSLSARVPLAYELHEPPASPEAGAKSPILFLHGFLGSKRENRQISQKLSHDLSRRVYALDLRNHGDSPHHPQHNYMELALDVDAFIKSHKLQNPTLIGHSMGAKTALTLALHSPNEISSVVAIDNSPVKLRLNSTFPTYLKGMAEVRDAQVRTHHEAEKILKDFAESPAIRLWLMSNLVKDAAGSKFLKMRLPVDTLQRATKPLGDFPYRVGDARFYGPTLFVRGLQSHYVPDSAFPQIAAMFPSSDVVSLDCGHWIVQDEPERLRQAIVKFIKTNSI